VLDVAGTELDLEAHVGPPGLSALTVDEMIAHAALRIGALGFPHLEPELHEHAVLLCVNVFKDKLAFARPHAVQDLELIATHEGFDAARFADVARRARLATLVWICADWLARSREITAWAAIRDAIGKRAPRPLYARAVAALVARGEPTRTLTLLARVASDDPLRRARALSALALRALEASPAA
jgi:hypothetical protein